MTGENDHYYHPFSLPQGFGEFDQVRATYSGVEFYTQDFQRDALGRLTALVNELGDRLENTYDAVGNRLEAADLSGNVTQASTTVTLYRTQPKETGITGIAPNLEAMLDPALAAALKREGIVLTTWRELMERRQARL